MPVSFNPYASQTQTAAINPFQQRNDDETSTRADEARNPSQTRPSNASASESQSADTKARPREDHTAANEDKRDTSKTHGSRRGGLVDVSV